MFRGGKDIKNIYIFASMCSNFDLLTKSILKLELNTNQSINQSINHLVYKGIIRLIVKDLLFLQLKIKLFYLILNNKYVYLFYHTLY